NMMSNNGFQDLPPSVVRFDDLKGAPLQLETHPAPLGVLWQQLHLPRRLARGDIDLFWSPLLTLPTRLPVPAIVTLHDLAVLHHPETLTWRIRASLLPFLDGSVRRADRIITVSNSVAREIAVQWPDAAARTEVIWNGVDDAFIPASAAEIAAIRTRLALPERYILFVGTIEPRKNLGLLLDAWETLRLAQPETPALLIVGPDGWASAETQRRIRRLEAHGLRRLGHLPRPDLIAVLQAATIFVFPSLYEGFGLPLAEAMACGVPVMAADRSSLPEVVGNAGMLFDPEDEADLAAALGQWLDAPELLHQARQRGLEQARLFTWKRSAEAHARLFELVIAEHADPRAKDRRR
ncbi:MAG: glycosyltransferase family 1 protein, partial [Thermoanaerobaculia bacterium]